MRIVIVGAKGTGKTSIGKKLSENLSIPFFDTDDLIEKIFKKKKGKGLCVSEIYELYGEKVFRELEEKAVKNLEHNDFCIIAAGGSTMLSPVNRAILRKNSILIMLTASVETIYKRISKQKSAILKTFKDPIEDLKKRIHFIEDILTPYADILVETDKHCIDELCIKILERLSFEFELLANKFSSFGQILKIQTFGESHGPAIGAVIDGIPPGIEISKEDIQIELNRRRPGQSSLTTSRNESDEVKILSGIFNGKTTGSPICLLIENKNQISKDYEVFKNLFRPGHADFTFWKKYGIRDHRGGGRSSGRETAARVAGGAIAKKILSDQGIKIFAYSLEIAGIRAKKIDFDFIEKNPVRSPDSDLAPKMEDAIKKAKQNNDSVGGIIEVQVIGVPPGLGDPVFGKLSAKIASAIFSLGAVKGLEFGSGFSSAKMKGSEHNDNMQNQNFLSNNAGGILGGISTGQNIIARIAVKPTPSISKKQLTCSVDGKNAEIEVTGRHDPCIVPRLIPVVESMIALVLLDCILIQKRLKNIKKRGELR